MFFSHSLGGLGPSAPPPLAMPVQRAKILATSREEYSWLICVWAGEWIRVLCNNYFLSTVIKYNDYFQVIVTLDLITEYSPTTGPLS